ncbi:alpha/beta hydrolase [Microbispora sp. NPDC088329]|uniref:alpha/beta fold hydrolase n=1 Tax=Microbispora sp. NPDC088329 TaxID=3154869 RepID=UPI00343EB934
MTDLLNTVLEAHGGPARWREARSISARQFSNGALWPLKGHLGAVDDVTVTVDLHRQFTTHAPFLGPDRRTAFTPDRVAIETTEGEVVEELRNPRASFAGHEPATPWTALQLAYFTGYAMWTYLTEPISLAFPGVRTEEIEPWTEDGEKFRRLKVTYPPEIATHSAEQILYVDTDGLLRRRDYNVDVAGGVPSAHYISGHQEVSGLVIPATRMIYARDENNARVPDPLVVSVRLDGITVSENRGSAMSSFLSDTVETRYVDGPEGERFAYRRFGRPATVPLVLTMRLRGTIDHWDPALLDALAAEREVIVFDNRGTGVGWSMGGFVVQDVALAAPDLVRRLVVAGSSALSSFIVV